jgi:hypothetical protein
MKELFTARCGVRRCFTSPKWSHDNSYSMFICRVRTVHVFRAPRAGDEGRTQRQSGSFSGWLLHPARLFNHASALRTESAVQVEFLHTPQTREAFFSLGVNG